MSDITSTSASPAVLPRNLGVPILTAEDGDKISLRGVKGCDGKTPWRNSMQIFEFNGMHHLTDACKCSAGCTCVLPWCIQYRYRNMKGIDVVSEGVAFMYGAVPTWRIFRMLCMADRLKRSLYELLLPGRPVNAYFDLDYTPGPGEGMFDSIWKGSMPRFCELCRTVFCDTFVSASGHALAKETLSLFLTRSVMPDTCKEKTKFSAHVVIKCPEGMLEGTQQARALYNAVLCRAKHLLLHDSGDSVGKLSHVRSHPCLVPASVFSTHTCFEPPEPPEDS